MDNEDHGPKLYSIIKGVVKKEDTAPDKFSKYQDEYEARGRPSSDKMQQVLDHNQTYPKLQKELDKRRSTGRVRVSDVKTRRLANSSNRSRLSKKNTRVIKKRLKNTCRCSNCLKLIRENSKGSQTSEFINFVMVVNRRVETETEPCQIDSDPERGALAPLEHRDGHNLSKKTISPPPSRTVSNNSFSSSLDLDHEPMV